MIGLVMLAFGAGLLAGVILGVWMKTSDAEREAREEREAWRSLWSGEVLRTEEGDR